MGCAANAGGLVVGKAVTMSKLGAVSEPMLGLLASKLGLAPILGGLLANMFGFDENTAMFDFVVTEVGSGATGGRVGENTEGGSVSTCI